MATAERRDHHHRVDRARARIPNQRVTRRRIRNFVARVVTRAESTAAGRIPIEQERVALRCTALTYCDT